MKTIMENFHGCFFELWLFDFYRFVGYINVMDVYTDK